MWVAKFKAGSRGENLLRSKFVVTIWAARGVIAKCMRARGSGGRRWVGLMRRNRSRAPGLRSRVRLFKKASEKTLSITQAWMVSKSTVQTDGLRSCRCDITNAIRFRFTRPTAPRALGILPNGTELIVRSMQQTETRKCANKESKSLTPHPNSNGIARLIAKGLNVDQPSGQVLGNVPGNTPDARERNLGCAREPEFLIRMNISTSEVSFARFRAPQSGD